ncbi:MAG: terminase large subunit domain-containing protein [Deltaproteobacteria bacterium]
MALSPAAFAQMASAGKWEPAPHLMHLDRALTAALEDAAEGTLDGLVVSMPPQHGKSELCSKYLPAWYLCNYPTRRVIVTGYGTDFAAHWGAQARDLVRSWGRVFNVRLSKHASAAVNWELEQHGGGMIAAGTGGPLTGKGANLLIIDDPIKNDQEARSAVQRENLWSWWQSTASTRLRHRALTLVIQTRWHRDDLAGRILHEAKTNRQRWREVRLPALAELGDPLGRAPGEPLWPARYPLDHLTRVRDATTSYVWRSLYQQDPITEGTTEWPEKLFGDSIWFDEWPREWRVRTAALDPSKGRTSKYGDYSAFVMLVVSQEGIGYVDADLAVRHVSDIVETAVEIGRNFRPDGFAVETNQFQSLLADEMHRVGCERGVGLQIYPFENHVPKVVRIRRLTELLARGRLRFKADSAGARLLVRQLRDFPNADHDDGPDALEMAVRLAKGIWRRPAEDDPGFTVEYVRLDGDMGLMYT